MLKKLFFILFLIFNIRNCLCSSRYLWGSVNRTAKVLMLINGIETGPSGENVTKVLLSNDTDVSNRFREMREELAAIEDIGQFDEYLLYETLDETEDDIMVVHLLKEFSLSVAMIEIKYSEFLKYLDDSMKPCRSHSKDWSFEFLISSRRWLDIIREIIHPSSMNDSLHETLFASIAKHADRLAKKQCHSIGRISQYLTTVYRLTVKSEIKWHIFMAFYHRYKYAATAGGWKSSISYLSNNIGERFMMYIKALSRSITAIQSSYFQNCAIKNLPQDESLIELNGLFGEAMFRSQGRFNLTCNSMWFDNRDKCQVSWLSPHTACNGSVQNCESFGIGIVCLSEENHHHKYKWVHSIELGSIGLPTSCTSDNNEKIFTYPERENICYCSCSNDIWKLYTGLMESRKQNNYVIIGARFILKDSILFLQPAQGRLVYDGYISGFSWIVLPPTDTPHFQRIDSSHKSLFFDDLQLNPGYVLTGIQFRVVCRGSKRIRGFGISVEGVPFDHSTGKLDLMEEHKQLVSGPDSGPQKELLFRRVKPIHFGNLQRSSKEYTHLIFKQSALLADFGQSTLPLFNGQSALPRRSLPLTGIEIFHEDSNHHSGFISLGLHSLNSSFILEKFIEQLEIGAKNLSDF